MATWLEKSSFQFGGVDMWNTYGIQIEGTGYPSEILIPQLRARKVTIPMRHGTYDYGAKYYDERGISVPCVTTRIISRAEVREIAYILSRKDKLYFWHEPDKYYIGRVYQAPTLEQLRNIGNRFSLTFICDPFAYGTEVTATFTSRYTPNYQGTAPTPTKITITNTGSQTITSINIVQLLNEE